ncbi:MAG: hypothetical protein JEY97_11595 [Bacteroidales bacterium]|nr:hypothetical protein [Bacteroidales bacterium]
MQYINTPGLQGICPSNWHLPTDDEWKILEGTVDSQYPVGYPIWNNFSFRGFDAGINLKSSYGWYSTGNGTDLFGFTALPGGYRAYSVGFYHMEAHAYLWTSTEQSSGYSLYRNLKYSKDNVNCSFSNQNAGFSVRCLKD